MSDYSSIQGGGLHVFITNFSGNIATQECTLINTELIGASVSVSRVKQEAHQSIARATPIWEAFGPYHITPLFFFLLSTFLSFLSFHSSSCQHPPLLTMTKNTLHPRTQSSHALRSWTAIALGYISHVKSCWNTSPLLKRIPRDKFHGWNSTPHSTLT